MPENTSSPSQKGRIFISYRRVDSSGYAGRIYDRLVAYFGEEAIFMDVDRIEGGTDFIKVLEDAVQSCDVLIALIGKQWLSIKDNTGERRLDNPEDFVRIEVATALQRNIRVIPVLVDGADMPQPSELPENLKALARRNALQVNHHSFNPDVYRLIEHSESALVEAEELRVTKAQALQAVREKAEKDAEEKAQVEADEQARKKAAKEEAERDAAEKARQERAQLRAARVAALKKQLSKLVPLLKVMGLVGTAIALIWIGSWGLPKLGLFVPTGKVSLTPTRRPVVFTATPQLPATTLSPKSTATRTQLPKPTSLPNQITDLKSVAMVLVPAGKFTMGSDADAYYLDEDQKPAHTVSLDAFYIDKYEVTNKLYKACVDAGVCKRPNNKSSYNRPSYYENSEFDNYPVIYVDWYQSKTYCEWRDARLPTEAEWEKAAQGTDTSEANQTHTSTFRGDTTKVGNYPLGKSVYGVYDMAGNVWEWVNDWYQNDYYSTLGNNAVNPQGPDKGDSKVLRGGSWFPMGYEKGIWNDGVGPIYNRYRDFPLRYYFDTGFRCAKDAQ